jgi:UDP-N-acetylglucosamine 4,6-dehydratase
MSRSRKPASANIRMLTTCLAIIRDADRLSLAMRRHSTVIHAAALKYVPEAEFNVNECIGVNVGGTQSVIAAARAANVARTVLISTDKAVEPLSTYGLTKALAERLFAEAADQDVADGEHGWFTCRYGNVIGSTGSVVPLFKYQQQSVGFVTVTNPTMTRLLD